MARNDFTTLHAAAHVAQYNAAQPITNVQMLALDERVDQLKNDLLIAKAENDQATIDQLRILWQALREEIDAIEVEAQAATDAAALNGRITINVDALVEAYEAHDPSNARTKAWTWIVTQDAFQFDHGALLVESSRFFDRYYRATFDACSCEARKPCYHMVAASIINLAIILGRSDA